MTTKRAYKLQEFVAHSSAVNCLKIGRKSSRVLVTGGQDHKVNLWAIGKPNALLSLSGHTSEIDSVSFDSSEVVVAAGAASGTIKLWDLEESKILRTLTGHRSNCISVDFHPVREFFASGSLDTNLKIWDVRKKGCIRTYKGHTRGVNAVRFSPDGRWVVSGGEDNSVKIWDLTAGKLLHDLNSHEGPVQCIDFHPHDFLLATGSADRTVKCWDLETFELIGTAGPETSGVNCMTFNPDGKTLLSGFSDGLKAYSWEPIRCHDKVDVGWSKLSDLNVHEAKLIGCSFNQNCVGIWVVDISRPEPYAVRAESVSSGNVSVLTENTSKVNLGWLSISQKSDAATESKSFKSVPIPANSNPIKKDSQVCLSSGSVPDTLRQINLSTSPQNIAASATISSGVSRRRKVLRSQSTTNIATYKKPDIIHVLVPRHDVRLEEASELKRENFARQTIPLPSQSKSAGSRRLLNSSDESEGPLISALTENKPQELGGLPNKNVSVSVSNLKVTPASEGNLKDEHSVESAKLENKSALVRRAVCRREHRRTYSVASYLEKRERSSHYEAPVSSNPSNMGVGDDMRPINMKSKQRFSPPEKEICSSSDEDTVSEILKKHDHFIGSMQSRLTKLRIVRRYWERHDIKAVIGAMEKMGDHGVHADVLSLLTEKADLITLEICTVLLPLLVSLLESDTARHLEISMEMLVKLVRLFGSVIYPAVSASAPSVGVDIEAEQRLERCNCCFAELERVKCRLPSLMRRGGYVAKSAQELSLIMTTSARG